MTVEQTPARYDPAAHDVTHVLHAVCAPLTSWYVPLVHVWQVGVPALLHVPLRNRPSSHVVTHALHAVCDPPAS